jgi:hypothetical protein
MKFIKDDGTIEEGTPLTDNTAKLRDELEAYLHTVVCFNIYHGPYGRKKCAMAAKFLALTVNNNQDDPGDYAFAVEAENLRLNPPPETIDDQDS